MKPAQHGPVLLVVAGGAVSQAAIARTAELAAGAPVTVVGIGSNDSSETGAASSPPPKVSPQSAEPEQVRRTVALAMSVLENTGVAAMGHVSVTGSPARAVARVARARGVRVVILDQSGALAVQLRRRMYGSGVVVLAATDHRGGWVTA